MLDPDRDQARELLLDELQKPEYNRPESFLVKAVGWLLDQLSRLVQIIPGSDGLSALLLGVVLTVLALGVYFAVRGTRRRSRLTDRATGPVLQHGGLSADDYRARAAAAARVGDWDAVLLDSYRAIAAAVDERALLDGLPGTTAHEVAVGLHAPFPDHGADLLESADAFDAVCYGDQHATRAQAERVRELDRVLARTRPVRLPAGADR